MERAGISHRRSKRRQVKWRWMWWIVNTLIIREVTCEINTRPDGDLFYAYLHGVLFDVKARRLKQTQCINWPNELLKMFWKFFTKMFGCSTTALLVLQMQTNESKNLPPKLILSVSILCNEQKTSQNNLPPTSAWFLGVRGKAGEEKDIFCWMQQLCGQKRAAVISLLCNSHRDRCNSSSSRQVCLCWKRRAALEWPRQPNWAQTMWRQEKFVAFGIRGEGGSRRRGIGRNEV